MNGKLIALIVTLLAFATFTVEVLIEYGYMGWAAAVLSNNASRLAMTDLVIALTIGLAWMFQDARQRGAAFWPFALVTLAFGIAGPLAYLIVREWQGAPAAVPAAPAR